VSCLRSLSNQSPEVVGKKRRQKRWRFTWIQCPGNVECEPDVIGSSVAVAAQMHQIRYFKTIQLRSESVRGCGGGGGGRELSSGTWLICKIAMRERANNVLMMKKK
jgi:hypothetical protein